MYLMDEENKPKKQKTCPLTYLKNIKVYWFIPLSLLAVSIYQMYFG